jgi:type II secretory pathway component PulF
MANILKDVEFFFARREFNASRERFYDDLAEAILDKESLKDFLTGYRDFCLQNNNAGWAQIYQRMLERMDENEGKLSHVLATIVPDSDLMTLRSIDAISEAPDRAKGLRFMGENIRKLRDIKKIVLKALMSPLVVTPIIIAFALIVCFYFVPEYEKIAPPAHWAGIGQLIFALSVVLRNYGIVLAGGVIALIVIFVRSFPRWTGAIRKRLDCYLPYRLYRDYQGANFLVALASLVNSKATLAEALEILEGQASPWMAWHIRQILDNMDIYPDDYAAAFDTGLLSPEIHMRLSTYARRTGGFDDGLIRLGTEGLKHVQETVEKSSSKLNIIAIFAAVGGIMFFYMGNLMISQSVTKYMKKQSEQTAFVIPADSGASEKRVA